MSTLDIHQASEAEKRQIFALNHEAWGEDHDREAYVEQRMASRHHARATWWVLRVEDQIASCLGCFPLDFTHRARRHPGFGLGAVYTPPSHRREGYAAALCREVIEHARRKGRTLGLLFSDIEPRYYERLGFQRFPSDRYRHDITHHEDSPQKPRWQPLDDPGAHREAIEEIYERYHSSSPLYMRRNLPEWSYYFEQIRAPFLASFDDAGDLQAYLRYWPGDSESLAICEWAVPDQEQELGRALIEAARSLQKSSIRCWYPIAGLQMERSPRESAITMLGSFDAMRPLDGADLLIGARIWNIDYF